MSFLTGVNVGDDIQTLAECFAAQLPARRLRSMQGSELKTAAEVWSEAIWRVVDREGAARLTAAKISDRLSFVQHAVFICGVHRSGTTLVRNLLDGHPRLSILPSEGGFLTGLRKKIVPLQDREKIGVLGREWIRRLANPSNQPPYWLLGRSDGVNDPYVAFGRQLLAWAPVVRGEFGRRSLLVPHLAVALAYSAVSGASGTPNETQWVDKTPMNEFHLRRLRAELPEARVIHVVRHPVAVYASRKRLEQEVFGTLKSPRQVVAELRRSLRIAAGRDAGGRQHLVIRYEDVVQEPLQTMERVASYLEIDIHPALLRPTVAGRPAYVNSSFDQDHPPGLIVDRTSAVTDHATPAEIRRIEARVGRYARRLGYSFGNSTLSLR